MVFQCNGFSGAIREKSGVGIVGVEFKASGRGHRRLSCGSYGSMSGRLPGDNRLEGDLVAPSVRAGSVQRCWAPRIWMTRATIRTGTQTVVTDQEMSRIARVQPQGELDSASCPSQPARGRFNHAGVPLRLLRSLLPRMAVDATTQLIDLFWRASPRPGESGRCCGVQSDDGLLLSSGLSPRSARNHVVDQGGGPGRNSNWPLLTSLGPTLRKTFCHQEAGASPRTQKLLQQVVPVMAKLVWAVLNHGPTVRTKAMGDDRQPGWGGPPTRCGLAGTLAGLSVARLGLAPLLLAGVGALWGGSHCGDSGARARKGLGAGVWRGGACGGATAVLASHRWLLWLAPTRLVGIPCRFKRARVPGALGWVLRLAAAHPGWPLWSCWCVGWGQGGGHGCAERRDLGGWQKFWFILRSPCFWIGPGNLPPAGDGAWRPGGLGGAALVLRPALCRLAALAGP